MVAHFAQQRLNVGRKTEAVEVEHIGHPLQMKAGLIDGLLHIEAKVHHIGEDFKDGS